MSLPVDFDTATARHGFPMLVAGQAQKEFFVNEALARIDALLHPAFETVANTPPAVPAAGEWILFRSGWRRATRPQTPTGGSTIDVEARAAIGAIIDAIATLSIIRNE